MYIEEQNVPTVTVVIPAMNEEKNIAAVIRSVLSQEELSFRLKEILVVSDGSTDRTVEIARSINDRRITVIEHKQRLGKPARLNEMYDRVETDILVQLDADIVFEHISGLAALIATLNEGENIQLAGGANKPLPGETYIEKAINVSVDAYISTYLQYKNGNIIYSSSGKILSLKKKLYKELRIPDNMIADDRFTYLFCVNNGYSYRYVPGARVLYRSPQVLADHISQNTRYVGDRELLLQYFPDVILDAQFYLPPGLLRREMFKRLMAHPILSISIYSINLYCKFRAMLMAEKLYESKWSEVTTSKGLR